MKRGAVFLAVCSFIILAFILTWPAFRVARAWSAGEDASKAAYSDLRRVAINSLLSDKAVSGPDWARAARAAWARSERLLAIVIRNAEGDVIYALPGSSPYYVPATSARGLDGSRLFSYPAKTVARYSGTVSAGLTLDALYATLRQRDVFLPLRDTLVALIIVLAISAAWLFAESAVRRSVETGAYRKPRFAGTSPSVSPSLDPGFQVPDFLPDTVPPPIIDLDDESGRRLPIRDGEKTPAASFSGESSITDRPKPATSARSVSVSQLSRNALSGPMGLFNPDTGLCWESYLRERLDSELKRSASFEQDLSLFIASWDNTERGKEDFSIFAKTIQDFFSFKDLSFEFGDSGLAVVLPNMDIDHAIRMSEELLKKLTFLLQGKTGNMNYLELFMGLSSRSGRLVEADRMVSESMAALRKAREERDTHIMAFRPDPEKFRAFLAGQ
ncbi:MAG: hypothetical protein E4H20_03850 [Spirochaetales bacterium]|nr:MAG: hypothetical protein E4H20_03850 [Spirochaetales bacterium]